VEVILAHLRSLNKKHLFKYKSMIQIKECVSWIFLLFLFVDNSFSQNSFNNKFEKIVFGCYTKDMKDFEVFVKRAKQSGATHINLSNEDLPFAKWEYDVENDPYPSWVFTNMGLLKIATPVVLKPYLPQDYAERVLSILEERCKILRKYGLKAAFKTFEPQMLPEAVFTDHPLWRGPRVDHPSRSRAARWAPDIDNLEVLQLYYESLTLLLKRCPEIEIISLTTNDSGTGLSWSGGLYSGSSGNTFNKYRRMDERLFSFFSVLQKAAQNFGRNLEIDISNTSEEFPEKIASRLNPGMAIENMEGPDGRPFKYEIGYVMDYYQELYPIVGIPNPLEFLEKLDKANSSKAKRLFVLIGDRYNKNLYFELYDKYDGKNTGDVISRLLFLKNIAKDKVGDKASESLLNLWLSLNDIRKPLDISNAGGCIFYDGSVSQRWLTRPFVPFPGELLPKDRNYFRKYQFQAKTEEIANDMTDLQASRVYSGFSGMFFVTRLMDRIITSVYQARSTIDSLLKNVLSPDQKKEFQLLDLRLQAVNLVCNNVENSISYQVQLDKAKAMKYEPDLRPEDGKPSSWERSMILETARKEIDNTALLIKLLESNNDVILDLAPIKELEDIRRLGPDFIAQLKQKLRIMNEHWLDYNRIYTTPNL
jgi:hypothetical protein